MDGDGWQAPEEGPKPRAVISPATPEDAPALARILGDWVRETGWMPVLHSREEDVGFLGWLIRTAEVQVLRDPGPIGFLVVLEDEEVRALYLAADARGRGAGARLLDRAKEGRDRLMLWTFRANDGARRFYVREGFTEVASTDGDNEERLPDVQMVWTRDGGSVSVVQASDESMTPGRR